MPRFISAITIFSLLAIQLSGCARDLSSSTYTSDSTLSLTLEGKVLSVRQVKIKNTDNPSDNVGGALAGGALGAVAGSNAGRGNGQAAAVVGGAVIGAVAGALIQDKLGEQEGFEYIVKIDTSKLKSDYYEGTGAMRKAISSATTSGLATIVQGKDVVFSKGQKVFVIFSDNRTRIIAAE